VTGRRRSKALAHVGGRVQAASDSKLNFNFHFKSEVNFNVKGVSPRASRLQATYFSQLPEK